MDPVAYQAKIDILEKKLARSQEVLESAREMSDLRGTELLVMKNTLKLVEAKILLAKQNNNDLYLDEAIELLKMMK